MKLVFRVNCLFAHNTQIILMGYKLVFPVNVLHFWSVFTDKIAKMHLKNFLLA